MYNVYILNFVWWEYTSVGVGESSAAPNMEDYGRDTKMCRLVVTENSISGVSVRV